MEREVERLFSSNGWSLIEGQVFEGDGPEYWHSVVVDNRKFPMAGGFASDRQQARKIAISELLERKTYFELRDSSTSIRKLWGLDIIKTACGFAGGYDLNRTLKRSLYEAFERWTMSMWIDDHFFINEIDKESVLPSLDAVSMHLYEQFDNVRFFLKRISFEIDGVLTKIEIGQTMAIKGTGIFPGSSAQYSEGHIWQHSLLESYRHLLAIKNNPNRGDVFPDNRVHYFAQHAEEALEQIESATKLEWPEPSIKIQRSSTLFAGKFFVARTILDGWTDWSEGPIERFLY